MRNLDLSYNISNSDISRDIKNLLSIPKLIKFKKSKLIMSEIANLAKSQKLDLTNIKKLDCTKVNYSKMDFYIPKAKKIFIHFLNILI